MNVITSNNQNSSFIDELDNGNNNSIDLQQEATTNSADANKTNNNEIVLQDQSQSTDEQDLLPVSDEPIIPYSSLSSNNRNDTMAARNGISNDMQKFKLQQQFAKTLPDSNKTSTVISDLNITSADNREINVDLLIPKGRTYLTDTEWRQGATKGYYEQQGYKFSQAAIEEAASRLYIPQKGTPHYVHDANNKAVLDSNGEKIPAYHISFTPPGGTIKADFLAGEAKNAREQLDQFAHTAQSITDKGTLPIAGTTLQQRLDRVKQIYFDKYAGLKTREAVEEIFSAKNLTLLGITEVVGKTVAAPILAAASAATMTFTDAPRWYSGGTEIKKLIYGAEKPSDLDKAALMMSNLVKEGEVQLGNMAIGKFGRTLYEGIPKMQIPDIIPTGRAVVTAGGPPLNWRMPVEPKPTSIAPTGDSFSSAALAASKSAFPGVINNLDKTVDNSSDQNIFDNNFGGPVGRPEAINSSGQRAPITAKTLEHVFHGEINKKGKAVGFHYEGTGMEATKGTKIIEPTRSTIDANKVYKARVEIQGVVKDVKSSFFPKEWSKNDVLNAINEAYTNKVMIDPARPNFFEGKTSSGITVGMYIDQNGNIATAFPIYDK